MNTPLVEPDFIAELRQRAVSWGAPCGERDACLYIDALRARLAVIEEDSLKAHNAELAAFRDVLSGGYASTHANRLNPEIYGILDEVRILVIEKGEAATEYREHVAEMEKHIAALKTVTDALVESSISCDNLHHTKADYHERFSEPCPVEARVLAALAARTEGR